MLPDAQESTYLLSSQFIRPSILRICVGEAHLIAECLAHVAQPYWPQGHNLHISSTSLYYCPSSRPHSTELEDTQSSMFGPMSSSHPASPLGPRSITYSKAQACVLGTVISTWLLMLIAMSLRFVARRLSRMALGYDDWLIIPAAVCYVFCPLSVLSISGQETRSDLVCVPAFCHNMLCVSYLE